MFEVADGPWTRSGSGAHRNQLEAVNAAIGTC